MITRSRLRLQSNNVSRIPDSDTDDAGQSKSQSSVSSRQSDGCYTSHRSKSKSRDVDITPRRKQSASNSLFKNKISEPAARPSNSDSDADENLEDYFAQLRSTIKKKPQQQQRESPRESSPPLKSASGRGRNTRKKKSLDSFIVSDSEPISIHNSMAVPDSSSSIGEADFGSKPSNSLPNSTRDSFDYRASDELLRLPLSERIAHYNQPTSGQLNFKYDIRV